MQAIKRAITVNISPKQIVFRLVKIKCLTQERFTNREVVIVHEGGENAEKCGFLPLSPFAEGYKGGGENPHNFSVYSSTVSAISAFSAVS